MSQWLNWKVKKQTRSNYFFAEKSSVFIILPGNHSAMNQWGAEQSGNFF